MKHDFEVSLFEGKPVELGVQQGSSLRFFIRELLDFARRSIGGESASITNYILDVAQKNINELYPEIIEEVKGIAQGAGIGFRDALLLTL